MATQLVLLHNDAVEVSYCNGSQLQLSSCGSTFVFHQSPQDSLHPLHDRHKIQQRTPFVTSEFRDKVVEALDFRNRFARHPYVCQNVQRDLRYETLHADIHQVAWPRQVAPSDVQILPDGSFKLTSQDQHAALTLSRSQCHFTVEYFIKTSQPYSKKKHQHSTKTSCDNKKKEQLSDSSTDAPFTPHGQTNTSNQTTLPASCKHTDAQEPVSYLSSINDTSGSQTHSVQDSGLAVLAKEDSNAGSHDVSHNAAGCDGRWVYAWIVQYHSVQDYPQCWEHPLKLLLGLKIPDTEHGIAGNLGDKHEGQFHPASNEDAAHHHSKLKSDLLKVQKGYHSDCTRTTKKNTAAKPPSGKRLVNDTKKDAGQKDNVLTALPTSLPLVCPAPHLHKWKQEMADKPREETFSGLDRIKVICVQGVIYRMLWTSPRGVEIYPGDGSIMKSTGLSGHFFTHYICHQLQVEERMYSVQSPPPHCPDLPYSVATLVTRAARFLHHLYEESLQLSSADEDCCWMQCLGPSQNPEEIQSRQLLGECSAPGLGRFTAFSSGHLRAVFDDRTCADMWIDLPQRHDHVSDNTTSNAKIPMSGQHIEKISLHLLPPGVCRLLLPSGHYKLVNMSDPGQYQMYTTAMSDWARWINTPPSERQNFYRDTVYDPEKLSSIQHELQKIRCFNFLMENTTAHHVGELRGQPAMPGECRGLQIQDNTQHPAPCGLSNTPDHAALHPNPSTANLREGGAGDGDEAIPAIRPCLPETFSMEMVQEALRRTSQHVQELDKLLNN